MNVLVTGGCGYLGAWMIPHLLGDGHMVTVYDTQWFGHGFLPDNGHLHVKIGDIRKGYEVEAACEGQDAVIHLASISAESMCQKYPDLAKQVNVGGAMRTALAAKRAGVERFIYASSAAIYGSSDDDATEKAKLSPTTIYGEGKHEAEKLVKKHFPEATIIRSASICGYSPHQRLDLTVNMMTHHASEKGVITVNGGEQKRSHIHIKDISDFYRLVLHAPADAIEGETFNAVAENLSVMDTAQIVLSHIPCKIEVQARTDNRSYTVDGSKARRVLGFEPKKKIIDAVSDLKLKFDCGMYLDADHNPIYQNMRDGLS